MLISEKLTESEKFSASDRKAHLKTLINFTDFAQLRLIMLTVQFMDYPSCKYLRESTEINEVIAELGLSYELY